jgi:hypothetical protein
LYAFSVDLNDLDSFKSQVEKARMCVGVRFNPRTLAQEPIALTTTQHPVVSVMNYAPNFTEKGNKWWFSSPYLTTKLSEFENEN